MSVPHFNRISATDYGTAQQAEFEEQRKMVLHWYQEMYQSGAIIHDEYERVSSFVRSMNVDEFGACVCAFGAALLENMRDQGYAMVLPVLIERGGRGFQA